MMRRTAMGINRENQDGRMNLTNAASALTELL
jgi:hypothetical protein